MEQVNIITRESKGYEVTKGLTAEGKSRCKIEDAEPHPVHQQPVRRAPVEMVIKFDEADLTGEVIRIETKWKTVLLSNAEIPLEGNANTETMISSAQDRDAFVSMFAAALGFVINGYVRADMGGNHTGWNEMPVYSPQGEVITYTPEQEATPPNNHYYNPPIE